MTVQDDTAARQSKNPSRRQVLSATGACIGGLAGGGAFEALLGTPAHAKGTPHPIINVRSYGAKGDGVTNDTDAFAMAAQVVNANGGGTILIAPGTYIVGKQTLTGAVGQGAAWRPSTIMRIANCTSKVVIRGLGPDRHPPVLKAANGLRFGSFDPVTGAPFNPVLPFTNRDYQANAYFGMIELVGNAAVEIENLELDGNIHGLELGGFWGDTGRQCGASGIYCISNRSVAIESVHTHHHGLDGVQVAFTNQPASVKTSHVLTEVRSEYNARQGLSWVGASGLVARRCRFLHTGRERFASAPGAGVDIEPEDTQIVGGLFEDCEIDDNIGPGVVSDGTSGTNAVSNVTFRGCRIRGTTTYTMIVRNPDFEFDRCHIVGSWATNPSAILGPEKIRFLDCRIDDAGQQVYRSGILIDCSAGESVLMRGCEVTTVAQRLAYLGRARVQDCRFIAKLTTEFTTVTDWIAILYGSRVENCRFEDQIPNRAGPILTINYSNETTMIGNAVIPPMGRIVLFNAS